MSYEEDIVDTPPPGRSRFGEFRHRVGVRLGVAIGATALIGGTGAYVAYDQVWKPDHVPVAWLPPVSKLPQEYSPSGATIFCAEDTEDCDTENALGVINAASYEHTEKKPEFIKDVLVASEDKTFYTHDGVSGRGVVRAMLYNVGSGLWWMAKNRDISIAAFGSQGGSTIARQTVKKLFMRGTSGNKLLDEYHEGQIARRYSMEYTKEEQLDKYWDMAPGGRNTVGLGATARELFGKSADELTEVEQIIIVAMLPEPAMMDVHFDWEKRANWERTAEHMLNLQSHFKNVTRKLVEQNIVTNEKAKKYNKEADTFVREDSDGNLEVNVPFVPFKPVSTHDMDVADDMRARGFVNMAAMEARDMLGIPRDQPLPPGLAIKTTLNTRDQYALRDAILGNRIIMNDDAIDAAGTSFRKDGGLTAMITSKRPHSEYQVNLATGQGGSGRSVGSALKPFVYGNKFSKSKHGDNAWTLKRNAKGRIPVAEAEIDVPIEGQSNPWHIDEGSGCNHTPEKKPPCRQTPEQALAGSSDMIPAQIINEDGPEGIAQDLRDLGVNVPDKKNPMFILGAVPTNMYELGGAYATFLNEGRSVDRHTVTGIWSGGKLIKKHEPVEGKQVIDPEASNMTIKAMKRVLTSHGTAGGVMSPPNGLSSIAGKSGTSDSRTEYTFAAVKLSNSRGARAVAVTAMNPKGNIPITSIKSSNHMGRIIDAYTDAAFDDDGKLDIAKDKATMPRGSGK